MLSHFNYIPDRGKNYEALKHRRGGVNETNGISHCSSGHLDEYL